MEYQKQFSRIITDDSLMETASHGDESYPFHFYYENLSLFDFNCIEWHWHSELEFILIEKGTVSFDVGAEHFDLYTGEGIMINSKILHRLHSAEDAVIPNFLFHPTFIAPADSLIYEKYIAPVISSSVEYIIFRQGIPWQAEILEMIKVISDSQKESISNELQVSMLIEKIWMIITTNQIFNPATDKSTTTQRTRLQLMMQFIHTHYSKDITLDDIAKAASVSKSTALHLFADSLKVTPICYLNSFRLKQAARLLANTEKKVTAISSETGFNNADYFCRSFKKAYGKTPTAYRRQTSDDI